MGLFKTKRAAVIGGIVGGIALLGLGGGAYAALTTNTQIEGNAQYVDATAVSKVVKLSGSVGGGLDCTDVTLADEGKKIVVNAKVARITSAGQPAEVTPGSCLIRATLHNGGTAPFKVTAISPTIPPNSGYTVALTNGANETVAPDTDKEIVTKVDSSAQAQQGQFTATLIAVVG